MRITRLSIRDFGGITIREEDVAPAGAIIKGANRKGKTSVLRALAAAFTGDGANADSVRLDAERAEITIDTDTHRIRRTIGRDGGSKVEVTNSDGDRKAKPAAWLRAQFSGVDPLRLLHAKPAEQRALILSAVPATVTPEQIRAWAPGLPSDFSTEGHGFEVIDRAREFFYTCRTAANARAKDVREAAERAAASVRPVPEGTIFPVTEAQAYVDTARKNLAAFRAQNEQHARGEERATATRERIAGLRKSADEGLLGGAPSDERIAEASKAWEAECERVSRLKAELSEAEQRKANLGREMDDLVNHKLRVEKTHKRAAELRAQADELESTIATMAVPRVPDEHLADALQEETLTTEQLDRARQAEAASEEAQKANALRLDATKAEADAKALDNIVRRLTKEAPAELLDGANGPRGLTLDGDTVRLDGVSLEDLCGQERMSLALRIAKRLSAAKVLLVDGLEALDPDQREAFVAEATADGFQLLGTLVDRGEVVFAAIEATVERSAAE